ncbi:MAG: hypothetical protein HZB39_08600 [Planctomycetes bacterium]|nr:hypothetical protein [Planctomycetota bacterium]
MRPTALLAAFVLGFAAWILWPSDEVTLVRSIPRRLAAAFSSGRASTCLDGFAMEYSDTSEGARIDRETIRVALLGRFGGAAGGDLVAKVRDESLDLASYDAESGTAELGFVVVLSRVSPLATEVTPADAIWEIEVAATLRREEDGEWRITRSTHRTVSGARPR